MAKQIEDWSDWNSLAVKFKPKKKTGKIGAKKKVKKRQPGIRGKGGAPAGNKNASQTLYRYVEQNYCKKKNVPIEVLWWLHENEEKLKGIKGDFYSEKTFDGEIRKNMEFNDAIECGYNEENIPLE